MKARTLGLPFPFRAKERSQRFFCDVLDRDSAILRVQPYAENRRYLAMDGVPFFAAGATHRHSWTSNRQPNEAYCLAEPGRQ